MKKYNVFAGLALCALFLFQGNVRAGGGPQFIGPETVERIKDTLKEGAVSGLALLSSSLDAIKLLIDGVVEQSKLKEQELRRKFEHYTDMPNLLKKNLSQQVETRINDMIELSYTLPSRMHQVSVYLFPTLKSKIFVLQNIQDFFEFKPEYTDLNANVYAICTKMARELEKKDAQLEQTNPDQFTESKVIDKYRNDYMKQYNISVATLSGMSDEELDKKIKEVEKDIFVKIDKKDIDNEFRALLAILTHLYFKKSQKERPMFVGADAEQKLRESQAAYAKKMQGITASVVAHRAAQEAHRAEQARGLGFQTDWTTKYPGLQLQPLEQAQQKEAQRRAIFAAEQAKKPAQPSLWSKITSWWYGKGK